MFKIKPIRTEADYDAALMRLEQIFDADPETEAGDEAEVLTMLVSAYEDEHFNIPPPDPVEAIRFRMDQLGINQEELARRLGVGSGRISEVLSRHRDLSLALIRRIHAVLKIPAESLIQEPSDAPA